MQKSVLRLLDERDEASARLEREIARHILDLPPEIRLEVTEAREWHRSRRYDIGRDCMVASTPPPRLAREMEEDTVSVGGRRTIIETARA